MAAASTNIMARPRASAVIQRFPGGRIVTIIAQNEPGLYVLMTNTLQSGKSFTKSAQLVRK
jgi:hypothetical protein